MMKFKSLLFGILAILVVTGCSDEMDNSVDPGNSGNPAQAATQGSPVADFASLESKYGPAVAQTIAANGVPSVNAPQTRASSIYPSGISKISMQPDDVEIPSGGTTRTVVVMSSEDNFTPFEVRAFDASNLRTLVTGTITPGTTIFELNVPAYVAAAGEPSARVVMFQFKNPETGDYVLINFGVQQAKPVTVFKVWSNIAGNIPVTGGSYHVNVQGEYAGFLVLTAMDESNVSIGSAPVLMAGSSQTSVGIDIWANTTGAPRQVKLYYMTMDSSQPVLYETWTQEGEDHSAKPLSLSVNAPDYIPETGGTYTVTLNPGSYVGSLLVRAYDIASGELLSDYKLMSNTQRTTSITIYPNPYGYRRPVVFQYSIPSGDGGYIVFEAVAQEANSSAIVTDKFELISNIPLTIPAAGGSYITTLVGDFKGNIMQIRAYDIDKAVIVSGNTGIITKSNKTATIEITANTSNAPRNIVFQYLTDSSGGYVTYYSAQQQAAADNFSLITNAPANLPYGEKSYTVNLIGSFTGSTMMLRAIDVNTNEVLSDGAPYITNSVKNAVIKLKTNYRLTARDIAFQYSIDQKTYKNFHTAIQARYPFSAKEIPGANLWLSNHNAKSKGMTGNNTMSWAVAMGVNTRYNSQSLGSITQRTENTGCNGYYEIPDKSDLGLWRVPTKDEWVLIKKHAWSKDMGCLDFYWTSSEKNSTTAYFFKHTLSVVDTWLKINNKEVRCVRKIVK